MRFQRLGSAVGLTVALTAGCLCPSGVAQSVPSLDLTGSIVGAVRDTGGIPQMGAAVLLFNRYEKLVQKVYTNAAGEFSFASVTADTYSLRVSMTSFVPALRRNIAIQPGMRSVLAINLANVLSSIELVYSAPVSPGLMSDEWKWVLRSSMTTRPVLRALAGAVIADPHQSRHESKSVFSDTTGLVRLSSGESGPFGALGNEPDLGTSFALATSMFGSNKIQVSGNIGYTLDSDVPTAGFRTSFSRSDLAGPEVKLMMRQVNLPVRGMVIGGQGSMPALRTMSITMIERAQITDDVTFDYGASLDSVTFLDRLNYFSPFGRLTYNLGDFGAIAVGFSSGAPPIDLLNSRDSEGSLSRDVSALGMLPRVSLRDGHTHVQRTQNVEIGYQIQLGSRSFTAGVYREVVRNGALTLTSPGSFYASADVLPELSSSSSVFNIGGYSQTGYTAALTQAFGENFTATLAVGRGGVFTTENAVLETNDPDELRKSLRRDQKGWVRLRVSGTAPVTHTRFTGSYAWTNNDVLTPGHVYLTQKMQSADTGLNVRIRQPLPSFGSLLPGRIEASAELRNLLAQGYLPLSSSDGRRLILTHSPRALRGGLSFIF